MHYRGSKPGTRPPIGQEITRFAANADGSSTLGEHQGLTSLGFWSTPNTKCFVG